MGTSPSTCGVSETGSIRGLAPPAYSESSKSGALPRAAWIIQAETPHGLRFFRQQSSRQVVWPGSCGPRCPLTLAGQVESRLPRDPRFRAPPSGRFQPHGERRRDRAMAVNHSRQLLAANAEPPGRGATILAPPSRAASRSMQPSAIAWPGCGGLRRNAASSGTGISGSLLLKVSSLVVMVFVPDAVHVLAVQAERTRQPCETLTLHWPARFR